MPHLRKSSWILLGLGLGLLELRELLGLALGLLGLQELLGLGLLELVHRVGLPGLLGLGLLEFAYRVGLRELLGLGLLGLGLLGLALGLALPMRLEKLWAYSRDTSLRACTDFFPQRIREEWWGDFSEQQWQWQQQGCSRWSMRLRRVEWGIHLVGAYVGYKVYDAVFAKRWEKF